MIQILPRCLLISALCCVGRVGLWPPLCACCSDQMCTTKLAPVVCWVPNTIASTNFVRGCALFIATATQTLAASLDAAQRADDPYFNKLLRIMATRCMTQVWYAAPLSCMAHTHHGHRHCTVAVLMWRLQSTTTTAWLHLSTPTLHHPFVGASVMCTLPNHVGVSQGTSSFTLWVQVCRCDGAPVAGSLTRPHAAAGE